MEIFRTENNYVLLCGESSLWIHKKTGEIQAKPAWELANGQDPECLGIFFGLIGRVKCPPVVEDTILLVRESVLVGELPSGHAVHKIKSISMLHPTSEDHQDLNLKPCPKHQRNMSDKLEPPPSAISKTWTTFKTNITSSTQPISQFQLQNETRRESRVREKKQRRIRDEFHRIFTDTDSFYYCPAGGDLTNSVWRSHYVKREIDDRFWWNKHMLNDISHLQNDSNLVNVWIMPIIQGYFELKECKTEFETNRKHQDFTICLISRRSRFRVGTRYKRRGLDEDSHCANYVETEQIVIYKKHVVSFVQIRGSIPLYWSQKGYKYRPPPQLHNSFEDNQAAMEKHLLEDIERYVMDENGHLVIVNLVERTGKEAVVGDAYSSHICTLNNPKVVYVTFDLHFYCRGMKFENVSLLIREIGEEINKMNYCWVDNEGLIARQNGVFRVNCIDCLDRTNVVQTAIAKEVLVRQLTKLGLIAPDAPNPTLSVLQQMWANNGDIISKQYAGTNALKGDITRTGGRKISGMMKDAVNSTNRFIRAFGGEDGMKQQCLELLQGVFVDEDCGDELLIVKNLADGPNLVFLIGRFLCNQNYPDTCLANYARGAVFAGLIVRYYLSRFKDNTRQAALDIMLGNDVEEGMISGHKGGNTSNSSNTESSSEDESGDVEGVAERVKQIIEDVKKLLVEDETCVTWAWALVNVDDEGNLSTKCKMRIDSIMLLIHDAYFVAEYDSTFDKVVNFERVALKNVKSVEILVWENEGGRRKDQGEPVLVVHYISEDGEGQCQHAFKSIDVRFFNNVAVSIKGVDQQLECLRAIAETIQATFEICPDTGNRHLEVEVKCLHRKGSMLSPEIYNFTTEQLSSLKTASSKAFFNVSSQFNKLTHLKMPANKSNDKREAASLEVFLSTAGIVRSNTHISSNCIPEIHLSASEREISDIRGDEEEEVERRGKKFGKCHSSGDIGAMAAPLPSSPVTTTDEPAVGGLKSLKFGLASATNALVSPSSPFSKFAKGMQHLGSNLDPRRLRASSGEGASQHSPAQAEIDHNIKIKVMWEAAGCRSKLLAL